MNKCFTRTALSGLFLILVSVWGCTKLDTTTLGTDLIPVVDNINTFADTIDIVATQHIFPDTVKVSRIDNQVLGQISNDDLFGRTNAGIYFQMKPLFFPYSYKGSNDTLVGVDSVVLCLSYKGFYGDSSVPQALEVVEIAPTANGLWDSVSVSRPVSYAPPAGAQLATTSVDIRSLKNQVKFAHNRDSSTYQIRIKLDPSYAQKLFEQDSALNAINNGFYSDSVFTKMFRGLGVRPIGTQGNAIMYISLTDQNTRLETHFRKRRNNIVDTVYSVFRMLSVTSSAAKASVTANNIVRDRSGLPWYPPSSDPVDEIYLQTTPGTYALLNIPRLDTYKDTNRIVHRAEIFMHQVPAVNFVQDSIFPAPNFLYLDLKDTAATDRYKPIYYDLNPSLFYNPDNSSSYFPSSGVDFSYYGAYKRYRFDPISGRTIAYYNINVTRYLQRMLINGENSANYTMRLFSPSSMNYSQYGTFEINYNNSLAFGRVRLGATNNPDYKMKMVVIWSKIK